MAQILQNTVVQGELMALLLTLSRLEPGFLLPTSEEAIPGLDGFIRSLHGSKHVRHPYLSLA